MCRSAFILVLVLFMAMRADSQNPADSLAPANHMVTLGPVFPLGDFTRTHSPGISAGYCWGRNRFGALGKRPAKIGFILDAGMDYFFGKSVRTSASGFAFKHDNFLFIHAYGGATYNLSRRSHINLSAGPALGLEKNYNRVCWGINFSGAYHISGRWSVWPGLSLMQDPGSDPLFTAGIKAGYSF